MGIKKGFIGGLKGIVLGTVAGLGVITGLNFYQHHDVNYEIVQEGKKVFQKVDGIFAYTKLEINEDSSVEIGRYSYGDNKFYTDIDGDENVDIIFQFGNPFLRGSHSNTFHRDKDLKQYPIVFQEADKDFRGQMQRFKPYTNK